MCKNAFNVEKDSYTVIYYGFSTAKERIVVLVYDISYERLDTSEEYRQEMREFQMAEPDVANTSALTLLTVEMNQICNYQREAMDEFKDGV